MPKKGPDEDLEDNKPDDATQQLGRNIKETIKKIEDPGEHTDNL